MSKPSLLRRILRATWNGITRLRLAISNLIFLLMLVLLYMLFVGESPEPLPERAALLLNPVGVVVDEKSQVAPLQALLGNPSPEGQEVLLQDIIDAVDLAREDPAINSLVMELDWLVHVGISKTQEIVRALQAFRAAGKPIVAVGDFYTQDQYLLASHADAIIMHPLGTVALEGYSSYRNYFREALEKLSVSMHVFRAGEYKSAAEHFLRDDMSPGEREVTERWLGLLWEQYTDTVEARRELDGGTIDRYIDQFAEKLGGHGGDAAAMAEARGLVDHLFNREEANDYLVELVGAADDEGLYEAVPFEHYLFRKTPLDIGRHRGRGARVAVITAQGMMLPGDQPPGTIGGDSLAHLIHSTADRDDVKAIVLRISSGGGSVFAAEVIRQQLLDAQARGIPLVVSMGGIAASGGYYIAAEADEIWATPSTITGSIGVYAAFPTIEGLLQRLGVHTDGVGTTELAGSLRLDRPLDPQVASIVNSSVEFTYRKFLQIVADGRGMTIEEADALGQGRVWGAPDALELGLLDGLGSLEDAIGAAAARADLEVYEVEFIQPYRSPRELLLQQLAERVGTLGLWAESAASRAFERLLEPVGRAVAELEALQDPRDLYMRCVPCAAAF
jgi:protease-4